MHLSKDEEMRELRIFQTKMAKKQSRVAKHLNVFFVCIIIAPLLICGCSHFNEGAKSTFIEANDFFSQGDYKASLSKYQQIIEKHPTA
ncbi:MAG: hypothetical protein WA003_12010, partial [Desulfuromonadaceae bacterium]